MTNNVLMIAALDGAENCARSLAEQIGSAVEVATTRRAALLALRKMDFAVVVMEQQLAESDPDWADQVWQEAGLAMPLQINFAISGSARLAREVKAALSRRHADEGIARRAVSAELENELKSSVTGLLLESELALRDRGMPLSLEPKLRHMVALAGALRERLRASG